MNQGRHRAHQLSTPPTTNTQTLITNGKQKNKNKNLHLQDYTRTPNHRNRRKNRHRSLFFLPNTSPPPLTFLYFPRAGPPEYWFARRHVGGSRNPLIWLAATHQPSNPGGLAPSNSGALAPSNPGALAQSSKPPGKAIMELTK